MSDRFPIEFNEIFTIPKSLRFGAVERINHLINFGQRVFTFLEFVGDSHLAEGVIDLVRYYHDNLQNSKLWVVHDSTADFSQILNKLNSSKNVVMVQSSTIDVLKPDIGDFVIVLVTKLSVDIVTCLLNYSPAVVLVVIKGKHDLLNVLTSEKMLIKLFSLFNTYYILDNEEVFIYELGVKRFEKLGYAIIPLSRIGEEPKNSIVLLYDGYSSFVKALIYLLNEVKKGNEQVIITSPNLPLIQKYVQSLRVTRKYNIHFVPFSSFINNPGGFGKGIIVIEHPYPDFATIKAFYVATKTFDHTILASNNLSFNAFIKSLLSKSSSVDTKLVNQIINLFNVIIRVHVEYSSMNSLVVECYTKNDFSLNRGVKSLIRTLGSLKADAVIKTVNRTVIVEMLESLGWTTDLNSNKKRVILIEPTPEMAKTINKQKIIITSNPEKYKDLDIPIIINFDKLL